MRAEAAALLEDAADLLEQGGWIKNAYQTSEGYCVVGAIAAAAVSYPLTPTAIHVIARSALGDATGVGTMMWNDAPERTKQEVLDALRGAAKELMK